MKRIKWRYKYHKRRAGCIYLNRVVIVGYNTNQWVYSVYTDKGSILASCGSHPSMISAQRAAIKKCKEWHFPELIEETLNGLL